VHGVHLAVPDRLDRQLADVPKRWPIRSRSSSLGRAAAELTPEQLQAAGVEAEPAIATRRPRRGARGRARAAAGEAPFNSASFGATVPPWSAAHAYTNLHGPKSPTTATVVGNVNCTEAGFENQTHHVVLDFGAIPFPVLEGQSIGIVPPGSDERGKPTSRASTASPARGTASGPATTTSRSR
jgi:benzoyl-CoA 2,3-dioxygenase component A